MSEGADPLLELVVDTQVSRAKLAEMLKGKVMLDPLAGSFLLMPDVKAPSSARQVVLLSLLARKALTLLKEGLVDALTPKEVGELTGLKGNTIRPVLRRLEDEGLIMSTQGRYTIHGSALARVANALQTKE